MSEQQPSSNQPVENAATDGSKSLVELLREKLPKCKICLNFFTEPKQLDCSHSFCKQCLRACIYDTDTKLLTCYFCETDTQFDYYINGMEYLEDNLLLISIGDELQIPIICNSCVSERSATMACIDCSRYLCEHCFNRHQFTPAIGNAHKTFNIEKMTNLEDFKEFQSKKYEVCSVHTGNKNMLVCVEDNLALCHTCAAAAAHNNHHAIAIETHVDDVTSKIKTEIAAIVQKEVAIKKENEVINGKLERKRNQLESCLHYLDEEEEAVIAKVKQEFVELKEECTSKFNFVIDHYKWCIKRNTNQMSNFDLSLCDDDLFSLLPTPSKITSASKFMERLNAHRRTFTEPPEIVREPFEQDVPDRDVESTNSLAPVLHREEPLKVQPTKLVTDVKIEKVVVKITPTYMYKVESPHYAHYQDGSKACIGDTVKCGPDFKEEEKYSGGVIKNIDEFKAEVQWNFYGIGWYALGENDQYEISQVKRN